MSHHPKHHDDKKHKKLQQLLKNRKFQQINQQEDALARGRDLEKEREDELREQATRSSRLSAQKRTSEQPVWSARLQEIRDRNTGAKRMATERWNRFAGTEESGGRGL
jgi:hypothetical protein